MWAFAIFGVYIITKLLILSLKRTENYQDHQSEDNESIKLKKYQHIIVNLLNTTFSFYEIIDSKLIGLIVFLNSNLLTGLVNLTIDTREVRAFGSVMILILHALASVGSGFLIYHLFNILKNRKKEQINADIA